MVGFDHEVVFIVYEVEVEMELFFVLINMAINEMFSLYHILFILIEAGNEPFEYLDLVFYYVHVFTLFIFSLHHYLE